MDLRNLDRRALINVAVAELGGDYNTHRWTKGETLIATIEAKRAAKSSTGKSAERKIERTIHDDDDYTRKQAEAIRRMEAEHDDDDSTEETAKELPSHAIEPHTRESIASALPELDPISRVVWDAIQSRVNAAAANAARDMQPLDDAAIAQMVDDTVSKYIASTVTITIERRDMPTVKVENAHCQFEKLLWYAVNHPKRNVFLWGAPGGGKTTCAKQVAEALGLPFYFIALGLQTTEARVFGAPTLKGTYKRTKIRDWYENGGVMLFDEFDNCNPNLAIQLNAMLENGEASFPDGTSARHPDAIAIAAANTRGKGGTKNHTSRMALDTATLKRFAVIEWLYDERQEFALCQSVNADVQQVHQLLSWIKQTREYCKKNYPQAVISPRESLNCASALAHGWPFSTLELVKENVLPDVDADAFGTIVAANPLPNLKAKAA